MTATSYVDLDNDDLGANKILRAATMSALDTNPLSIAQRGTGAPWLNGIGAMEIITTGSGNWTVPAGVYRVKVTATGGGGGGGATGGGGNGGDTTFSTITGGGGKGSDSSGNPTASAAASGGTLNITGMTAAGTNGANSLFGCGGRELSGTDIAPTYGGGGFSGGGSGAIAIKIFSVEPGDLLAYAIGSGGTAGTGGQAGADGLIIIEY